MPGLGDGLTLLSRFRMAGTTRTTWAVCNGLQDNANDCLTPKGFQKSSLTLPGGRSIEIYNLHADAGRSQGDKDARVAQLKQPSTAIARDDADKAVIVGGDFNLLEPDAQTYRTFLTDAGLTDSCAQLGCANIHNLDRIAVRSGRGPLAVNLTPTQYVFDTSFVDEAKMSLSDHEPVHITVTWRIGN
jgi:endonuclease/exonuclease/phosphatase family metal-dependent hydrolase